MRPAAPEHKTVYVRFHRRVDELLEAFSVQTGMKRAAADTFDCKLSASREQIQHLSAFNVKLYGGKHRPLYSVGGGACRIPLGRYELFALCRAGYNSYHFLFFLSFSK